MKQVRSVLSDASLILMRLQRLVETALAEYRVESQIKHLPQEDLDGLYNDYKKAKQELADKLKELL